MCTVHTYLGTWSGFEAAKTAPWPSRDSTLVNSLSPQMSDLKMYRVEGGPISRRKRRQIL